MTKHAFTCKGTPFFSDSPENRSEGEEGGREEGEEGGRRIQDERENALNDIHRIHSNNTHVLTGQTSEI